MYCTYLTTYSGNKLPPFYIGKGTISKIEQGYHGSVSSKEYKDIWEQEQQDNPHLFKTNILTKHITTKEAYEKEEYFQKKLNVVKNTLYINKAISYQFHNISNIKNPQEKFYLNGIRIKFKVSDETKRKISNSNKGKTPWNKGKLGYKIKPPSIITKNNISRATKEALQRPDIQEKLRKPKSEEHKLNMRNKIGITNDIINKKIKKDQEIPLGFRKGYKKRS